MSKNVREAGKSRWSDWRKKMLWEWGENLDVVGFKQSTHHICFNFSKIVLYLIFELTIKFLYVLFLAASNQSAFGVYIISISESFFINVEYI